MSVDLREVLAQAEARRVALGAETAGHLVLGLADLVVGSAREIEVGDCRLDEEGTLVAGGRPCTEAEATRALRALLGVCLGRASAVTQGLARVATGTGTSLPGLVRELEVALVPSNRTAAGRSLRRLYRAVVTAPALPVPTAPPSSTPRPSAPPPALGAPPSRVSEAPAPPSARAALAVVAPRPVPVVARPAPTPASTPAPRGEAASRTPLLGSALSAAWTPSPTAGALTPPAEGPTPIDTMPPCGEPTPGPAEVPRPMTGAAPGSALGSLLGSFSISDARDEGALRAELRRLADVDPTPPPAGPFARWAGAPAPIAGRR